MGKSIVITGASRGIGRATADALVQGGSISSPAALERWNPNLIGGDFVGGAMDIRNFSSVPHPHSIADRVPVFTFVEHPLLQVGVSTE